MQRYTIATGALRDVLAGFPDNSFDGLLCDPPYGLSFMGKHWDYDVPSVEDWAACLRVLKPGAPLLAFGGSRTFHRIVCGIEDAGFEIRDSIMWVFGKGFPKSLNVGKALDKAAGAEREIIGTNPRVNVYQDGKNHKFYAEEQGNPAYGPATITGPATDLAKMWDGYGTALKPAHEPICLARKPLDGTVAENVTRWGVGALAIDSCRVGRASDDVSGWSKTGSRASENVAMTGANYDRDAKPDADGRWPANLLFDEDAAEALDEQVGPRVSRPSVTRNGGGGGMLPIAKLPGKPRPDSGYSDSGGPSRFFTQRRLAARSGRRAARPWRSSPPGR